MKRGDTITLSVTLHSRANTSQRLAVDYTVHYIKKRGAVAPKVFKLKLLTLQPDAHITLTRRQVIRDFSTRIHYAGTHRIEIFINGVMMGHTNFELKDEKDVLF